MIHPYLILAQKIRNELNNIQRIVDRTLKVWSQARLNPTEQDVYVESVALNLQSFYTGVERLFQLIVEQLEQDLPSGKYWHSDLLRQVSLELPGTRPAVINQTTQTLLDDFLSFRHRVRNIYTYHLDPEKVGQLAVKLPETYAAIQTDMAEFLNFLDAVAQTPIDET